MAALRALPELADGAPYELKKLYWGLHVMGRRPVPLPLAEFANKNGWCTRTDAVYFVGASTTSSDMVAAIDHAHTAEYQVPVWQSVFPIQCALSTAEQNIKNEGLLEHGAPADMPVPPALGNTMPQASYVAASQPGDRGFVMIVTAPRSASMPQNSAAMSPDNMDVPAAVSLEEDDRKPAAVASPRKRPGTVGPSIVNHTGVNMTPPRGQPGLFVDLTQELDSDEEVGALAGVARAQPDKPVLGDNTKSPWSYSDNSPGKKQRGCN
jgi:hypothetical protein